MPDPEWGVKRLCPSCGSRFYDLNADPLTCPNCGASFSLESLTAPKGKAPRAEAEKPKPKPEEVAEVPDLEDDDVLDDDDEDVPVDDDTVLEDDEDTVDLDEIADVPSEDEEN
ncbi:MAG: TIGR02300 family protein [Pseudomonadota bacterium]